MNLGPQSQQPQQIVNIKQDKPTPQVRFRDVSAVCSVLMIGGALIFTILENGAPPSGNLSVAALIIGTTMLVIGYGGGVILDKLGKKYPVLVRSHNRPLVLIAVVVIMAVGLFFVWNNRANVADKLKDSARSVLTQVNEQVDQIGLD